MLRLTDDEYRDLLRKRKQASTLERDLLNVREREAMEKKRSKYGNRKVELNGKKFDSKHELEVYLRLAERVRRGELKCVLRQVPFDLPGGIKYIADFVTITPEMRIEGVYDAKSEATKKNRVYINKKKQMKALWGIEIREV